MQQRGHLRERLTIHLLWTAAILCLLLPGLLSAIFVSAPAVAQTSDSDQELYALNASEERSSAKLERTASFDFQGVPLEEALWTVAREGELGLSYNTDLLAGHEVTLRVEEQSVSDALQKMLAPTDLEALVTLNEEIVIVAETKDETSDRKPRHFDLEMGDKVHDHPSLSHSPSWDIEQDASVSGVVTDSETGESVPGASVVIEELQLGDVTGPDGQYEILDVEPGTYTLTVSFLGYRPHEETIDLGPGEAMTADIALRPDELELEEVVVTGVGGETRRREVGTTISTINPGEIDEPVLNIEDMLQGRISGATINPSSGAQGAGAAIRMRGNISLSQSNQPLIYIDGVRQGADDFPLNRSEGAGFWESPQSTASPLGDLNPNTIENMEIVKGPSATTLFGSEAAPGVIQVMTRTGHDGDPEWNYRSTHRFDDVQSFGSDQRPYVGMDPFLSTGYGQQHNLSVSGGGSTVQYFASGVFEDSDGIHPNDSERRFGVRTNLSFQPTDELTFELRSNFNNRDMTITHVGNNLFGLQFNAFRQRPGFPNNTVGSTDPDVMSQLLDAEILQENTRIQTSLTARWAPIENLDNRLTLGLDRMESEMMHDTPFGFILRPSGSIGEQTWINNSFTLDYVGNYRFDLTGDLSQRVSWGGQLIERQDNLLDGFGSGLPGPGEHTISAAAERLSFSNEFRIVEGGAFGETMFDLQDRLFLTFGARFDGQSTFGEDLGLQFYPKVSASYVISEEEFWPSEWWSNMRLRAALGSAGRAPGAFDAVRTFTPASFGGEASFRPANVGNPELGPERSTELEIGAESSFLGEQFVVDFTYYHQWVEDALFNVTQRPSLGFPGTQLENVGSFENRGIELSVDALVLERENFSLDVGADLSTVFSEVTDTGGEEFTTIIEGEPAPAVVGTRVTNPDEVGDPEFERDHVFGPDAPTHIAGLNLRMGLPGGLRFTARGQFQGGNFITQGSQWAMTDRGAGAVACDGVYERLEYDQYSPSAADQAGITAFDRAHCYSEELASGLFQEPADFIKLRELTLRVPLDFVAPTVTRSASLAFSARNIRLWTHSDFTGFDPEMMSSRAGLTALTRGVTETTPSPMRFTVSLNVSF